MNGNVKDLINWACTEAKLPALADDPVTWPERFAKVMQLLSSTLLEFERVMPTQSFCVLHVEHHEIGWREYALSRLEPLVPACWWYETGSGRQLTTSAAAMIPWLRRLGRSL